MKFYAILLAGTLLFAACNNEEKPSSDTEATTEMETPATENTTTPMAQVDPVCEMERDASWVDYSVQGTDTVWFCSETCKSAFEGNPAKYMKKS